MKKEYGYYQKIARAFTGQHVDVRDIKEGETDLGYACNNFEICVNYYHPLALMLPASRRKVFRMGVFAHELFHLLFTDFDAAWKRINVYPSSEAKILKVLLNVMEDPAIEYWGRRETSGDLYSALEYSIKHIYVNSRRIQDADTPYGQFLTACIHFGDLGTLIGHFTDMTAERVFQKALPIIDACIEEPNPQKRIRYAEEVFELTRPLWQTEDDLTDIMEDISQILEKYQKSEFLGQGKNILVVRSDLTGKSEKEKCRKAVIESVEDEGQSDGKGFLPDLEYNDELIKENEYSIEKMDSVFEITEENIQAISNNLSEKMASTGDWGDKNYVIDLPVMSSPLYSGTIKIENLQVLLPKDTFTLQAIYEKKLKSLNPLIQRLYRQLIHLFQQDGEEMYRACRGKLNIKKIASGIVTPRVFDKKRYPAKKSDMSVFILIDASGSMSGEKIKAAEEACIVLCEVFRKLNVPIYVMTHHEVGGTEIQEHYIGWKNTMRDRFKLLSITSRGCNFDGYAIRSATEILKKKKTSHKLMFILSDGTPNSSFYASEKNALTDTFNAVRQAKKEANVIGIAVGECESQRIAQIYEKNFFHIENCEDLSVFMANEVKNVVRKW